MDIVLMALSSIIFLVSVCLVEMGSIALTNGLLISIILLLATIAVKL